MSGTIEQIAEMAGVSRGTVDRALHRRGRVDAEVAQQIEQIAEEIGYRTREQKREEKLWSIPKEYQKRIGVVTQLAGASFMISVRQGIEDVKKRLARQGIEVILSECEGVDETEQLRQIEELMAIPVDGLAIMPVECEAVRTRLNRLIHEENVPVITFNTDIAGVSRTAFVGMDNRRSGQAAAGLLSQLMRGKGQVLGIVGSFSNSAGMQRMDGFAETLKNEWPGMELVGVQPSFDRSEAVRQIVAQAMRNYPHLGGIIVVSGGQEGVRLALQEVPKEERPRVILFDRTPRNATLLQDGFADFVIDQDGYSQGYRSVSLLADKLRWNKEPEQENMYTEINIRTVYTI